MEENKELTLIEDPAKLKLANPETGYLMEFEQDMKGEGGTENE